MGFREPQIRMAFKTKDEMRPKGKNTDRKEKFQGLGPEVPRSTEI